jgi:FRG domain.
MDEIRAESWTHLHELLFADSWHAQLGRHRSDFVYRGEASTDAKLMTSLQRLGGDYAHVERHLLRNFRKYARPSDVPVDFALELGRARKHHGLATRLARLDVLAVRRVALRNRVPAGLRGGRADLDGRLRKDEPALPQTLRDGLEREGMNAMSADLLLANAETLGEFDRLGEDFVAFFDPPALDQRIVNQYALFSLMPSPHARMDEWLEHRPGLARRVILPLELKWECATSSTRRTSPSACSSPASTGSPPGSSGTSRRASASATSAARTSCGCARCASRAARASSAVSACDSARVKSAAARSSGGHARARELTAAVGAPVATTISEHPPMSA